MKIKVKQMRKELRYHSNFKKYCREIMNQHQQLLNEDKERIRSESPEPKQERKTYRYKARTNINLFNLP